MALDGGSGALYVTTHGHKLWRSHNPDALDPNDVQWELIHDFGRDTTVESLASGWSPQGLGLYANIKSGQDTPVLHRSLDSGQTWEPLPIEF
jgi:hypothetical protein